MTHGIQGFFLERGRAARRVAGLSAGLAMTLLIPLLAMSLPPFRRPVARLLNGTARFGYEGHDQYVRRITLHQMRGRSSVTREAAVIEARGARAGGAVPARRADHPRATPETRPDQTGTGSAPSDMLQRTVSRLANVPVVQSEELVIVHAAMPTYPQAESDRGVEGRVMIQALVDTTGRVVDVQLLASTGVRAFERSAADAVWQYRFRPYRPAGVAREVYAIFRFAFRI